MPRLFAPMSMVLAALLLAGCQLALPGADAASDDVTPNAVAGDAIEVTTLDDPAPVAGVPPAAADGTVVPPTDPATEAAAVPVPTDAPGETAPDPSAAPEVVEEAAPPAPKSERQIACERRDGTWASAGSANLFTCIYRTRDGGKRCTRESDCEGQCLARSGTCAPIRPLLGCNEILQDNGARVTQCIE